MLQLSPVVCAQTSSQSRSPPAPCATRGAAGGDRSSASSLGGAVGHWIGGGRSATHSLAMVAVASAQSKLTASKETPAGLTTKFICWKSVSGISKPT